MFKNKILIFIILIIALLSIGVASATESSTDNVGLDDSTTEVVTSMYDENTSLDVASEDNSIETSSQDVKTFNSFSSENTQDDVNTTFSNDELISSNSATQNDILASGEPKTFTQLNEAISTASGTLTLDSNYTMTADDATTFAKGITISKNIAIDGKGFTIDANKLGRIFNVNSGYTLSLTNLTLAYGKITTCGGAIYNNGTLTLTNVNFINNSAKYGGAIYNNSTLTLTNVNFVNSSVSEDGGAIYNEGSGFTVSGCSFVNNSAYGEYGYGGAIFLESSGSVNDSVFINNSASFHGGAIYNDDSSDNLTVSGCSFVNSFGLYSGGAICNDGSGLTVSNSTFVNCSTNLSGGAIWNEGSDLTVSNSTFVNNFAVFNGGAIGVYLYSFTVSGCTFVNNSANYGGAINVESSSSSVSNCTFVNNFVNYKGDAIYCYNSCTANDNWWGSNTPNWDKLVYGVTHESYAVLNLTATVNKVAINFYKSGTTEVLKIPTRSLNLTIGNQEYLTEITGGTFEKDYSISDAQYAITASVDNEKLDITVVNRIYVDPNSDGNNDGSSWDKAVQSISKAMAMVSANGKIYLSDGTHIVDNQITIDKTVTIIGNGTKTLITNNKNGNRVFSVKASDVAIYNSTFVNNSANYGGGAISVWSSGSGFTVSGCTFVNNSARTGGAIDNSGSGFTVSGCTFVNNSASTNGGGAIWNYGSGFTVADCSFVNNSAGDIGGAIDNSGSGFTVSNSVFVNNTATNNRCNAIYSMMSCTANDNWWGSNTPNWDKLVNTNVVHDTYAVLSLTATNNKVVINFYKNGTTTEVLKIPTRNLNLTIDDKETIYGEITDGTFKQYYTAPAGEYNVTAVVDNQKLTIGFLNKVYVNPNGSDDNTGASWSSPFKTIQHAMDVVLANGNIYLSDGTHIVDSQITIGKTVAIVGNGTKTLITNNKNGNGVFKVTASDVAIYNSTFVNSSVSGYYGGGAIYVDYYVSGLTVSGCTFVNNSATYSGGAIYAGYGISGVTVSNCSFDINSANYGGAISNSGSGLTVSNCSFVNNSAAYSGGVVYNSGSGLTVSNCSFVNNSAAYSGGVIYNSDSASIFNSKFDNNTANNGVIYNWGILSLNNNEYSGISEGKTYIYNEDTLSSVNITVLENKTVKAHPDETIVLNATITCDGASVAGGTLKFIIGGEEYEGKVTSNYDGTYTLEYSITYFEEPKVISASYTKANGVSVKNATLKYSIETFADLTKAMKYSDSISLTSDVKLADGESFPDGITISKDFTINGNGFTIDANKLGRIFNITAGTVNLNNVTLANGRTADNGGAILNNGDLTLTNVTLTDNSAEGKGDAIYNLGTLSLNNNKYSGVTKDKVYIYNDGTLASCVITVLESKTINKYYGEKITLFANVTCDGASVAGGTLSFTIDNNKYEAETQDNGNYTYKYTIGFSGEKLVNAIYKNADANYVTVNNAILNVSKYDPKVNVTIGETEFGKDLNITVQLPKDTKGNVTIIVDGITYNKTIENCNVDLAIKNLEAGLHGVIVKYPGSEKYLDGEVIKFVNITKVKATLAVNIKDISYSDAFTIEATLTGINTPLNGNVIVTINNKNYAVSIKDGKGKLEVSDKLPANEYQFIASWYGDDNYSKTDFVGSFKIAKINPTIEVISTDIYVGEDAIIEVILPEDATGEVIITVDDVNYTVKVENGAAKQNITGLKTMNETSLTYLVHVKYLGDNNYNNLTALDDEFTVYKVSDYDMNVTIPSDVKYGDDAAITVGVPSDATGNVTVTVDGENYTAKVENGTAKVIISPLSTGIHNITTTYNGDEKYDLATEKGNITVIPNDVNLTVDDVVMIYHDGTRLIAKLVDALGNPIANTTLIFAINGREYNRTTDINGTASIALNLESGKYNTTITYLGNESYKSASVNATVTITPSIIGEDIVKMYQNDTQFYAKFLGTDGNPLANTTVRFNINGVFYNRTTNENGTAILNINLNPGNYTLTAYNPDTGEQQGFNVLVRSLIEASDFTKYYNNESKFQAKIYNKDGSLAVNKSVKFNINGVFYTRETDANGIVSLDINLRPGNYTITTTYDGLSIGNNVKVLPTLITNDLTMTYKDGSKFNATVLDAHGNPLANQNVTFNVNGVFYNKVTGDDGIASLNINLFRGEYIITSIWNEYQTGNKITIS